MAEEEEVILGRPYRDAVTGFEGIATFKIIYLGGCVRYCLETMVNSEPKEAIFDEDRLLDPSSGTRPKATQIRGGQRPAPSSRSTPSRSSTLR